jgi:4-amino-4-deoxy-L-arabinose transferase-like glycosyltransferase
MRVKLKVIISLKMEKCNLLQQYKQDAKNQILAKSPALNTSAVTFALSILFLLCLAIWMRWHTLSVPFDRDSYDEGVYWQSLRSLANGQDLHTQIFSSQPPAFLLTVYPLYLLFGQTIGAARLTIGIISLLGFVGILFVGQVLQGKGGAVLAVLLLVVNPVYLAQSQILQADAPVVALMVLALGFAYLWWHSPTGLIGYSSAIVAATVLFLSLLTKLFAVANFVPVSLLIFSVFWRYRQRPITQHLPYFGPLLAALGVFLLLCSFGLLLFWGSLAPLWDQVVTFHIAAKAQFASSAGYNRSTVLYALATPLGFFAGYGAVISLLRRDWRVLPLLAWLLTICFLLWQQVPLFNHHLVTLVPPLILLTIMGLGPYSFVARRPRSLPLLRNTLPIVGICIIVIYSLAQTLYNYQSVQQTASGKDVQVDLQVVHMLKTVIRPDQLIITDAQFLVAEANRSTPPQLVDTSSVRIQSGYLTSTQLIQIASQPNVHAILFYTGRLQQIAGFEYWVNQHFRLVKDYGSERELWIKSDYSGGYQSEGCSQAR